MSDKWRDSDTYHSMTPEQQEFIEPLIKDSERLDFLDVESSGGFRCEIAFHAVTHNWVGMNDMDTFYDLDLRKQVDYMRSPADDLTLDAETSERVKDMIADAKPGDFEPEEE